MAKRIQGGGGQKFVQGEAVVGLYRGMREGQFGPDAPLVDIESGGEVFTYYGKTVLARNLVNVPEGVFVVIEHLGLKPGKNGKTYNDYLVVAGDEGESEEDVLAEYERVSAEIEAEATAAPAAKPAPAPKAAAPKAAAKPAPKAAAPAPATTPSQAGRPDPTKPVARRVTRPAPAAPAAADGEGEPF